MKTWQLRAVLGCFDRVPEDPFYQPRKPLWLPEEMVKPPALEEAAL